MPATIRSKTVVMGKEPELGVEVCCARLESTVHETVRDLEREMCLPRPEEMDNELFRDLNMADCIAAVELTVNEAVKFTPIPLV